MPQKRKHDDYYEMPSALDAEKASKGRRKQTIAEAKRQNRITAQFANFMSSNGPELQRKGYNTNEMNRDWSIDRKEKFMKKWKSDKSKALVVRKNQKKSSDIVFKDKNDKVELSFTDANPRSSAIVKDGIRKIDSFISGGNGWGEIVSNGIGAAATAISGDPAIGMVLSNVLKGIWNNRDVLKKAWGKIKGFFGRIFGRKKTPAALPPTAAKTIENIANKEMSRPMKDIAAKMKDYYSRAMNQTELGKALSGMEGQDRSVKLIDDLLNNHVIGQDEAVIAKGVLENDKTIQYMLDYSINSYKTIKNLLDNLSTTKDPTRIESLLKGLVNTAPQNTGELALVPVNTGSMQTSLLSNGDFLQQVAERLNNQVIALEQGKLENAAIQEEMKKKEIDFQKAYDALKIAAEQKITDLNREQEQRTADIQATLDQTKQDYKALSEKNQALISQNTQNELALGETKAELREITGLLQNNSEFMQTLAFKHGLQVEQNNGIRSQLGLLFNLLPQLEAQLDKTNGQLKDIANDRDSQIVTLRKAEGEIVAKQQTIQNLEQSITTLNDKLEANNKLIVQYNNEKDKAAKAVVEARNNATAEAKQAAQQELVKVTAAANSEITSLKNQNADLSQQITALTQQSTAFQAEVDKFKAQYEAAVQEKDAAVRARELTEASLKKANDLVNGIRNKNNILTQELRDMGAAQANYRDNEASLQVAVAQKQQELVEVREENRVLSQQLTQYKNAARDLAAMQNRSKEEKALLEKEKREAEQQVARFKHEIEKWQKDEQRFYAPQKVNQEIAGLQAQMNGAQEQIQHANAQMQQIDNNIEIQIQRVRDDADHYRAAALAVANVDPSHNPRIKARIGTTGGAYLVGSAPDWNLGPTPEITRFWTNFYNSHYHNL